VAEKLSTGFFWHSPDTAHLDVTDSLCWWQHHYELFEGAILSARDLPLDSVRQVLPQIREEYLDPVTWTVYSDVSDCLTELSLAGWRQLILSNHVPELADLVKNLGLLEFFEAVFTSAEIGFEKPNAAAFGVVLKSLPNDSMIWMVGDNYCADVLGAESVGIPGILVRRCDERAEYCAESLDQVWGIVESDSIVT